MDCWGHNAASNLIHFHLINCLKEVLERSWSVWKNYRGYEVFVSRENDQRKWFETDKQTLSGESSVFLEIYVPLWLSLVSYLGLSLSLCTFSLLELSNILAKPGTVYYQNNNNHNCNKIFYIIFITY